MSEVVLLGDLQRPDRRRRVCSSLMIELPGLSSSSDRAMARVSIDVFSTRPLLESDLLLMQISLREAVYRVATLRAGSS